MLKRVNTDGMGHFCELKGVYKNVTLVVTLKIWNKCCRKLHLPQTIIKKMRNSLAALLLCLLAGCTFSNKEYTTYSQFPETKELKGTVIELDTALFRYPFRIRVQDDLAVILDLHNTEHYYHVFSYPEFRYLNSFGKRGNAPEEVLSAENFRIVGEEVWGLDANKRELRRWGIASPEDSIPLLEILALDEELLRPLDFALCRDSMVIPDYSGQNRLCWVDRQGDLIRKEKKIPTGDKKMLEESPTALAQAWRSFIDYNPKHDALVAVTQLGEVLEIYNGEEEPTIVHGPNSEPEFKLAGEYAMPAGIMGFSDVQVTDNYIYTVFHGRTFKDIIASRERPIDGGESIYVFTLQGEPVRRYVLDHHIYAISVDEEAKTIIATDVNMDQPIVRFMMD